jgi:hypothetical protein
MTVHRDRAEIEVADRDPAPAQQGRAHLDDDGGRGLALVAALSTRWGQEPHDGRGKKVWSWVRLPAGSAVAEDCSM